ncbi:DNA ligase [Malassezia pachydermatis]
MFVAHPRLYIQARPFHMTSESLLKYLTNPARPLLPPTSAIPPSIEALLDTLARGEVRGHAAKQLVHTFLDRHGIAICTSVPDPLSTFDVFLRCLDRRLRMGVSASTLRRVWTTEDRSSTALLQALDTDQRVSWPLPIALAQTWTGPGLPPTSTHWYASRKHDGVRCLALVRLTHGVVTHVDLVSRTGRVLTTLSAVATSLQQDLQQAGVAAWGEERAFVLDGELCALDDAGQESFVLAASQVQRPTELATLVYYPFDLLPLEAWLAWRTSPTPPFAERYARLQQMLEAVSKACPTTCLRRLPHVRLTSEGDWTSIQHRAAVEGWEGLMLRDDVPFQGRRTPSLRKVRRREEAEFVVEDIDVTTMRLPVDGTYADRVALASRYYDHSRRRHSDFAPWPTCACRFWVPRGAAFVLCGTP